MNFVDFVEHKSIPTDQLAQILQPSIAQNRHANFGPVSNKLESMLNTLNGNAPARAACTCANATLGLQAAVAVFENALGTHLRWAVSDFGFFTSFQGPFQNQTFVTCDDAGRISLDALAALPVDSYDAILATNVFGLHDDFDALFDLAEAQGKVLLIDNAAGFTALAPYHANRDGVLWAEVVSFHHTKPWGMGEGGAIFLPRNLHATAHAAINFGAGGGRQLADTRFCTNAKLSEIAAAQILARVEAHEEWSDAYRVQAARIHALGKSAGLTPMADVPSRAVPGQIAFLSDRPIDFNALENPHFRSLKYYRPGAPSGDVARDLFERVVNVPCHGDMAAVPDAVITNVLSGFA